MHTHTHITQAQVLGTHTHTHHTPHHHTHPQAQVLGFETRKTSSYWMQPVGLRSRSPDRQSCIDTTDLDEHLSPTYGPGQNSPKELASIRTTRALQVQSSRVLHGPSTPQPCPHDPAAILGFYMAPQPLNPAHMSLQLLSPPLPPPAPCAVS